MKSEPENKTALTHQRWEYFIEYARNGSLPSRRLTELGGLGWELCGTVATPDTASDMSSAWPAVIQFYFKRPIPPNPTAHRET